MTTEPVARSVTRDALRKLRKDATSGGVPLAYVAPGGQTVAIQGDDNAPFLQSPPFVTPYMTFGAMPDTLSFLHVALGSLLAVVDVAQWRTLQWEFDFTPGSNTSVMNVMPLGGQFDPTGGVDSGGTNIVGQVSTLMAIDNVINYLTVGTIANGVISDTDAAVRQIAPMAFSTRPGDTSRIFGTLQFDVSGFELFGISAAEIGDNGNLGVLATSRYSLSM